MTHYRPITLPDNAEPLGIVDQPSPMLQWIDIAVMVIDDQYQRPINHGGQRTIKAIAANFRWSCFTPVLLAPIEGGLFAVIDGQHRVHAAMLCGIKSVPAMVVPIAASEQAKAFIQVNTARTGVSQFSLLKAGLTAGEDWAIRADKAVKDAGCNLMRFAPNVKYKRPGDVLCVGLVREMVTKGNDRAVTVALTALRALETGGNSDVLLYMDAILNPLIRAVADHPNIDVPTLIALLRRKRPAHILDAAERLAKTERRGRPLVARELFGAAIRQHLASEGVV